MKFFSFFNQMRKKQPKVSDQASITPSVKTSKPKPGAVYIQDYVSNGLSKLYTLDLTTGKGTFIREIVIGLADIAFVGSELYGIVREGDKTKLVKIDLNYSDTTAISDTTVTSDIGFAIDGLAYNALRQTLYATTAKELIVINLKTGKGIPAVKVADQDYNCGEVAFDAEGKAYITLIGYNKKKLLASCDIDTGEVKIIGDTGFPNIASIEFVGDILYGVTGNFFNLGKDGQLICINTTTGKGALVTKTNPIGRWAGITIYETATEVTTKVTLEANSDENIEITEEEKTSQGKAVVVSQENTTIKEEGMSILTIDTQSNCYVINQNQMNNLQQDVASSLELENGTFDIKINSGLYSYANTETEGEPFVFLWIYGADGNTFVNKNTGCEVGATWTTLNGYSDSLQLEVNDKIVVCALFFDVNNTDNSGSINLLITSSKKFFNSRELTVDSKKNCYLLDDSYLSNLKQEGSNVIELTPGNYRVKIRESNATYWSSEEKFQLEPWALLLIQGGKFIAKLTGMELEKSWCSLNGLEDEVILEVKEKTILSGIFFDTYKEDNEGQIILAIEPVSATELAEYQNLKNNINKKVIATTETVIDQNNTSVEVTGAGSNAGGGLSVSREVGFSFQFDQAQIEQMWQQMAAKIETSVTVTDEPDAKKEAYWDNLEKSILKGYQTQAKNLAMQVARVEFMTKALTQQMEVSFNQNFQAWSGHFDKRLNELVNTRISTMVDSVVNVKIANQTQEIKNLVVQQMQTDIDQRVDNVVNLKIANQTQEIKNLVVQQMQTDIDQRINNTVNLKVANQTQEINNLVIRQMETDIDQRIDNVVNRKVANQTQEINNLVIQQIQTDVDQRINAVVNLKIADQTQNIKNLVVQQMQTDVDQRIDAVVNLKVSDQIPEINNLVVQQIHAGMEQRIDSVVNLKIADQTQNIKNLVVQQMQTDIDQRINSVVNQSTENTVQVVVNNVITDVDNRINVNLDNKILNFRNDISSLVRNELTQNFTESIKTTIISDINKQQFYLDMQSIKAEVQNFYTRLGQFETQLYSRINQGDTQLYNWTLEQLVILQGCLTDRQALGEMFETFAAQLRTELDNAPCVNPTRFTPWVAVSAQPQLSPVQPQPQLPGS